MCIDFVKKMGWSIFWAILSQFHLAAPVLTNVDVFKTMIDDGNRSKVGQKIGPGFSRTVSAFGVIGSSPFQSKQKML
jgi:hypothetical protein